MKIPLGLSSYKIPLGSYCLQYHKGYYRKPLKGYLRPKTLWLLFLRIPLVLSSHGLLQNSRKGIVENNIVKGIMKCKNVLLKQNEIEKGQDEIDHNSIQCDQCMCWYHYKCQALQLKDASTLGDNWYCNLYLKSQEGNI